MADDTQAEPRSERAAVTLTASEKAALRLVSAVEGTDESTLLRENTVAEIVARADEIRKKVAA